MSYDPQVNPLGGQGLGGYGSELLGQGALLIGRTQSQNQAMTILEFIGPQVLGGQKPEPRLGLWQSVLFRG